MAHSTINLGDDGLAVRVLHQALAENGFSCENTSELSLGVFGSKTLEAVKLFQACNVGPDGEHLVFDGVVGPKTWWALENCGSEHQDDQLLEVPRPYQKPSNPIAAAALSSALAELRLGVREVPNGSNRGPRVDVYTGFSGSPPEVKGPPWCAYFASWNFAQAPGGSPFGNISSARGIVSYCQKYLPGSVVDASDLGACGWTAPLVQPGDLGVISTGLEHGHVFHVAAVEGDTIWTVEGNSGNAVRARKRAVSSIRWFVDFDRFAHERGL